MNESNSNGQESTDSGAQTFYQRRSLAPETQAQTSNLDADAEALLRCIVKEGSIPRDELLFRSRLTKIHLEEVLDQLEQQGVVEVKPGTTTDIILLTRRDD